MLNPEEGTGSSFKHLLDSMRGNPSCIAALMMAALFAILTYWTLSAERREMHERQLKLIERCTITPERRGT
jgi:hypothetical protein